MESVKETSFSSFSSSPELTSQNQDQNKIEVKTNISENAEITGILPAPSDAGNLLLDTFENLYTYIVSVHSEKLNASNIIIIATELMQIVEKYKTLTGIQKKTLVINVVKKLVNTQFNTPEDKRAMELIIDFTLPIVIDNLISAINGNLKFDKEKVKSFFRKLFCCS